MSKYGPTNTKYGKENRVPAVTEGVATPESETKATATYTGATNAGFILTSKLNGTLGNGISYKITTAATDTLVIVVTDQLIDIQLANTTSSKNTATLVKAAIEANTAANALVYFVLTGTGAGVVATQAVANLVGGLNGTVGNLGDVRFDTDGNRWELIKIVGSVYYWKVDGYPAANTEYISRWDSALGKIVYKALITGNTPNSASANQAFTTAIASGVGVEGVSYRGVVRVVTGNHTPLPVALSTKAQA